MRLRKSLLIVLLLSFGLTGCYTQLEYSQKMKRVTSERPSSEYSWSEDSEEKERANLTEADSIYIAETYGAKVAPYREGEDDYVEEGEYYDYENEDYIPIQYKDYDVIDTYDSCNCNPYKTYNIYNNYYPSYGYYGGGYYSSSWYRHWPSYYAFGWPDYRWRWRYNFGFNYYKLFIYKLI